MISQPSWIHVWDTGELIRTLNSHHPNLTRGNFFKGATQQCFKDLLDLCHRALCPIISPGSCIWSHKDIFRSMLAGKMGKLQRTCGARSLSSTRLDLLLTAVTWGHAWTDRLLSHPLLDCGDTHASLYPQWAPAFTFTHTPHLRLTITIHSTKSHTPHPVCVSTWVHFFTHPLARMYAQTHTLHRGPLALLPLHLAHAICSTRFVGGWQKAALGWWCCGATWWKHLSRLVEDLCHDLRRSVCLLLRCSTNNGSFDESTVRKVRLWEIQPIA